MAQTARHSKRRAAWLKGEQRLRESVRGARATLRSRRPGAGRLPDFLVIGGMRCGTTSLFSYLAEHPLVDPAIGKELQYFSVFHDRGEKWYRGNFPPVRDGALTFEASPYYLYHPLTPARVAAAMPEGKFIALLRDPVDRAYSHYKHTVERGVEPLSFADAIAAEEERLAPYLGADLTSKEAHVALRSFSYASRGLYAEQLSRWYAHVAPEQILVLRSESMYADPAQTYAECLAFLGLPDYQPRDLEVHSRTKPAMVAPSDDTLRSLRRYFAPHNEELGRLVGWDHTWPSDVGAVQG